MKERIQLKHDIAENWAKAINFIPLAGELILYDGVVEDGKYLEVPRLKVGDGIHKINELPFISNEIIQKTNYEYTNGILKIS